MQEQDDLVVDKLRFRWWVGCCCAGRWVVCFSVEDVQHDEVENGFEAFVGQVRDRAPLVGFVNGGL